MYTIISKIDRKTIGGKKYSISVRVYDPLSNLVMIDFYNSPNKYAIAVAAFDFGLANGTSLVDSKIINIDNDHVRQTAEMIRIWFLNFRESITLQEYLKAV